MKTQGDEILDPVVAYDRIAPFFSDISDRRKRYLASIDRLVAAMVPSGSRSLLDAGAGDGRRALLIAKDCGLDEVVLLEPSPGMMKEPAAASAVWKLRAEDLGPERAGVEGCNRHFDVITCLWNVLGHIRPEVARLHVLRELGELLSPEGRLFVDVNHRYNSRAYGLFQTVGRFLHDRLSPNEANGDVTVSWNFGKEQYRTYGHVFTDQEIRRLSEQANLVVCERVVVDYETGETRDRAWDGNLFYVFRRRNSASDSSSLSQTSPASAAVN
jgi:SAM-dependent methyltransferase